MKKPPTNLPFNWEIVGLNTFRAKVFGGWLIRYGAFGTNINVFTMEYVPDPYHEWEIDDGNDE